MLENFKETKAKYFVIALVILIVLGIVLIVHFNNKTLVNGKDKEEKVKTTKKIEKEEETDKKKVETKTTKKDEVVAVVTENPVYKSTVDSDTNFVYNYKLTDEILDTDKIVAKEVVIPEKLNNKDIISLYDISLYSSNNDKKTVKNSLISVRIPIQGKLKEYEDYKVIYINDNYEITDEEFKTTIDDNYIEFETTHLSMYGIIGVKKTVDEPVKPPVEEPTDDLSNLNISVFKNGEVIDPTQAIYVSRDDEIDINVNTNDCYIYYLLSQNGEEAEYVMYTKENKKIFENLVGPNVRVLNIKVTKGDAVKYIQFGTFNIYDIVYMYDKNAELTEDVNVGVITNEDGSVYDYSDIDRNNDIVVKDATTEVEEPVVNENDVAINLYGNVYLVEETDISKLNMTGYLVIDTDENISTTNDNYKNLYTITIKSKEFMINGIKYTYEYSGDDIILKKVVDEETSEDVNSSDIFGENIGASKGEDDELIIKLREQLELPEEPVEPEEPNTPEVSDNTEENQNQEA